MLLKLRKTQSVTRFLLRLQNPKASKEINFEESDLLKSIQQLSDPRTRWTQHSLIDIVTIAIMAVLSGADDWKAIQAYGEAKQEWLSGFLELPNGIPSHDTFNNVISRISPVAFAECCIGWMREAAANIRAQVITNPSRCLKASC
jgi:predicted transposase YbfD/YdcC